MRMHEDELSMSKSEYCSGIADMFAVLLSEANVVRENLFDELERMKSRGDDSVIDEIAETVNSNREYFYDFYMRLRETYDVKKLRDQYPDETTKIEAIIAALDNSDVATIRENILGENLAGGSPVYKKWRHHKRVILTSPRMLARDIGQVRRQAEKILESLNAIFCVPKIEIPQAENKPTCPKMSTCPSKNPPVKALKQAPPKRSIAAALGVDSWKEIEIKVLANGIKYRRAGTDDAFLSRNWGALDMKGKTKGYALLIELAKHKGTYPKRNKENRRNTVHDLNVIFRHAFGLSENPFHNVRQPLGTQSIIGSLSWGGR